MKQSLYPSNPILIVDDESHTLTSFDIALRSRGITNTIRCNDSRDVDKILQDEIVEIILLDLTMPHVSGQEILVKVSKDLPDIPVIVVTGLNEIDTVVECMRQGAFDYVLKPVQIERLLPSVRTALEIRQLRRQNSNLASRFLTDTLDHPEIFSNIITQNSRMQSIFQYCEAVAEGRQPVMITGETGTGKELFARALHGLSGRQGEFVAVNVAGLDDNVFSDTLFGHAKGAFTGANCYRPGLAEKAAGGTLFLDEIGDLTQSSQVKLLRFMEEREFFPLGSDVPKTSDARILVASHKDLEVLQADGRFRRDLYYRFKTHKITIPPLHERREDIPLLLDHFLDQAAHEFGKSNPTYHQELITLLQGYHFPGNVRELKAMTFDAVSRHKSKMLSAECFKAAVGSSSPATGVLAGKKGKKWVTEMGQLPTIKEATNTLIAEAMQRAKNNQRVAALMLGITPQALNQRLKRSGNELSK